MKYLDRSASFLNKVSSKSFLGFDRFSHNIQWDSSGVVPGGKHQPWGCGLEETHSWQNGGAWLHSAWAHRRWAQDKCEKSRCWEPWSIQYIVENFYGADNLFLCFSFYVVLPKENTESCSDLFFWVLSCFLYTRKALQLRTSKIKRMKQCLFLGGYGNFLLVLEETVT